MTEASLHRDAIERALLPAERHRLTVLLVLGSLMYPAFGLLDWLVYPGELRQLLAIRVVASVGLLLGLFAVRVTKTMRRMYLITSVLFCLTSFGISLMVWLTAGASSPYYAGLSLVMMLVCVVFTWPLRLSILLHLVVFGSYLLAVFLHPGSLDLRSLVSNLFFLVSTMVVAVVGGAVRYRLTISEVTTKLALERSHADLEALARIDPLTGLLNRRTLEEKLKELLSLSRRYDVPSSVLLIDLDAFKAVNDVLGHRAGDELLKRIADELKATVRDTDLVYRVGGDEFLIVLQNQSVDAAACLAARLEDRIKKACSSRQLVDLGVGASIGALDVKHCPGVFETPSDVYEAVDALLYQRKAEKRARGGYMPQALRG